MSDEFLLIALIVYIICAIRCWKWTKLFWFTRGRKRKAVPIGELLLLMIIIVPLTYYVVSNTIPVLENLL